MFLSVKISILKNRPLFEIVWRLFVSLYFDFQEIWTPISSAFILHTQSAFHMISLTHTFFKSKNKIFIGKANKIKIK